MDYFQKFMMMQIQSVITKSHTIFLFDSGIGGLSILQNIKKNFPTIKYIYLLDNQAFPYGNKKESFLIDRCIKIISKIKKQYPISLAIIACNTASIITLSILRKTFNFPILGITPLIQYAKNATKNNIIGLIATEATIKNMYIKNMINKYSYSNHIKIIATNELAKIAEQKIRNIPISKIKINKIFQPWIVLPVLPDTIILGCTHFLFLKKNIQEILYKNINFIDSSSSIISKIEKIINYTNTSKTMKNNVFLYSKKNAKLKTLLFYLKRYNFQKIKKISI